MKIAIVLYHKELLIGGFQVHIDELTRRGHEVKVFSRVNGEWMPQILTEVTKYNPDVIWTWNGKFDWYGGLFYVLAQKYRVVVSELGWLPQNGNHFICEFNGPFHNCLKPVPPNYQANPKTLENLYKLYAAPKQVYKDYIFVPLQLENDTSITARSYYIKTMVGLVESAKALFPKRRIIVKAHPRLPDVKIPGAEMYTGPESSLSLAVSADWVVSINSTLSVEVLLWNRKVICFGRSPAWEVQYDGISLLAAGEGRKLVPFPVKDIDRVLSYLYDRQYKYDRVSPKVINYIEKGEWV